jgi:hypothetical protein
MMRLASCWRTGVALVATYALILQALLAGLAPLAHAGPNSHDSMPLVLCLSSDHSPTQDNAPGAPTGHSDAACCILCLIQGLNAANPEICVATPDYQSSRSSRLAAWVERAVLDAAELSPINPRAPPHFS